MLIAEKIFDHEERGRRTAIRSYDRPNVIKHAATGVNNGRVTFWHLRTWKSSLWVTMRNARTLPSLSCAGNPLVKKNLARSSLYLSYTQEYPTTRYVSISIRLSVPKHRKKKFPDLTAYSPPRLRLGLLACVRMRARPSESRRRGIRLWKGFARYRKKGKERVTGHDVFSLLAFHETKKGTFFFLDDRLFCPDDKLRARRATPAIKWPSEIAGWMRACERGYSFVGPVKVGCRGKRENSGVCCAEFSVSANVRGRTTVAGFGSEKERFSL